MQPHEPSGGGRPTSIATMLRTPSPAAVVSALLLAGAGAPAAVAASAPRAQAAGAATATRTPHARAAVIGGAPAAAGQFAGVVDLVDRRGDVGGQCTGTVVAPRLVLTAGHCAENMRTGIANAASGYHVLVGSVDVDSDEGQLVGVSSLLPYEGFDRRVDAGDAALLVLSTPVNVAPVALATPAEEQSLSSGTTATMVGWGKTHFVQSVLTPRLQWSHTAVQSARWCRRDAPPFYPGSELCTVTPPTYANGLCSGDSGGPLLAPVGPGGESVEVGIAIHVYGRCSTRLPSVYTSVGALYSWLRSWIDAYATPSSGAPEASAPPGTPGTAPAPAAPGTSPAPGTPASAP